MTNLDELVADPASLAEIPDRDLSRVAGGEGLDDDPAVKAFKASLGQNELKVFRRATMNCEAQMPVYNNAPAVNRCRIGDTMLAIGGVVKGQ
jgi:hypothetical protein